MGKKLQSIVFLPFENISSHLADIDARVLIIIGPVTERQAKFLLAVLSAQFHLLL